MAGPCTEKHPVRQRIVLLRTGVVTQDPRCEPKFYRRVHREVRPALQIIPLPYSSTDLPLFHERVRPSVPRVSRVMEHPSIPLPAGCRCAPVDVVPHGNRSFPEPRWRRTLHRSAPRRQCRRLSKCRKTSGRARAACRDSRVLTRWAFKSPLPRPFGVNQRATGMAGIPGALLARHMRNMSVAISFPSASDAQLSLALAGPTGRASSRFRRS
jgi:hypothetical protein